MSRHFVQPQKDFYFRYFTVSSRLVFSITKIWIQLFCKTLQLGYNSFKMEKIFLSFYGTRLLSESTQKYTADQNLFELLKITLSKYSIPKRFLGSCPKPPSVENMTRINLNKSIKNTPSTGRFIVLDNSYQSDTTTFTKTFFFLKTYK